MGGTHGVSPEIGAGTFDGRIPLGELGERDGIELQNIGAVVVAPDVMELVAVSNHAGLDGLWRFHPVCGSCGGRQLGSCGRRPGSASSCAETGAGRRRLGHGAARASCGQSGTGPSGAC